MTLTKKQITSQAGIASLMVTMVLMIVISLIVLGFAQVARREQRNTLDRQLGTQAFYAAESGINDAQDAIDAAVQSGTPITSKTGCTDNPTGSIYDNPAHPINYDVNPAQAVKYTCLLVSTQVPQLTQQLGLDGEWVVPVYPVAGDGSPTAVSALRFIWPPDVAGNTNVSGCQGLSNPTLTGWTNCDYGALRIDLVPVPVSGAGSNPSRSSLANSDMVLFAYPSASGGTFTYNTGLSNGSSHQATAKCDTTDCSITINGLTAPSGSTYYARVHMLYKTSGSDSVKIDAGAGNSGTLFSGAQAQIDSTGKAQDVLRRLRVAVNLNSTYQYSPYALMTRDSICKRYAIAPGIAPEYQVPSAEADPSTNPMCATTTSTPSDPNGNAAILAGCGADHTDACNSTFAAGGVYHYDLQVTNGSTNNAPLVVSGCTWNWGDGTSESYGATSSYCVKGQSSPRHTYATLSPEKPYPQDCRVESERVTLTMHFSNAPDASNYSDAGIPDCW